MNALAYLLSRIADHEAAIDALTAEMDGLPAGSLAWEKSWRRRQEVEARLSEARAIAAWLRQPDISGDAATLLAEALDTTRLAERARLLDDNAPLLDPVVADMTAAAESLEAALARLTGND